MSDLINSLNDEWESICAAEEKSPETSRLPLWVKREPALAAYGSIREIEFSTENNDEVLGALIRLAQGSTTHPGESLAGRVVLQRMMGAIRRQSARLSKWMPVGNARSEAVSAMWEQIMTLAVPAGRHRIAANLAMNTHRELTPEHSPGRPTAHLDVAQSEVVTPLFESNPQPYIRDESNQLVGSDLPDLIQWGRQQSVLTDEAADLLLNVYVNTENIGPTLTAIAARSGATVSALEKRCSRARKQLAEAVAEAGLVRHSA